MNVEIRFPAYDSQRRSFVTWRPVEVRLRLVNVPAGSAPVRVVVAARAASGGGMLAFATRLTHQGAASATLSLPASGAEVPVWVGGAFPRASARYGDVEVEVRAESGGQVLGRQATMVRIRKNANGLSTRERDRFLAALATLNGSGSGRFVDFRDMHVAGPPDFEAHGGPGFLPWHRAYVLDLERELQAIDAEVTLPYWRFDRAAPNLFHGSFIGVPNRFGQVQFASSNPLRTWVALNTQGVQRGTGVGPNTVPALFSEAQTLGSAGGLHPNFAAFAQMQFNPHGRAHTSHGSGWITGPASAPRDPLFFLLHCNVDRLWAKWQWAAAIHDPADPRAFTAVAGFPPGHRLNDRLWPWSGPLPPPRPQTAPGGALAASPMTVAPGPSPRVRDMIDYLGTRAPAHHGFAYDDVPFQM